MSSSNFCALPQELQTQILCNVDAISIARCAMTCKSIYEILQSSSLLRYTVQLHFDGLKDAGTLLSYSERIEFLMRRRRAWLSLEKQGPFSRHMPSTCDGFELAGGAFALAHTDSSNNQLEILWLPTASNAKGHTLQRPSIGISARVLTMDPTQDLIVMLEDHGTGSPPFGTDIHVMCIHIRSISTNAIHPLAQQSPLQLTVTPEHAYMNTINKAVLRIAYNILAIYFRRESTMQLLIWDWTTSDLILDTSVSFDPNLPISRHDFGLLDATYFFITCQSDFGSIRLYKLVRSHEVTARATHLATLRFPPTSFGTQLLKIYAHTGPIEANPLPHEPVMICDEDRLHTFTMEYYHKSTTITAPGQFRFFNLFLHQRVLLKYARQALTETSPLDIPWSEWGPPNTRFTDSPYKFARIRCIHGQRAVFSGRKGVESGCTLEPSRFAEVFDFSLAAVLFAKGTLEMPHSSSKSKLGTLLPSSILRTEDVPLFLDDVETHLPCVVSTLDFDRTNNGYMIYADGIIGIEGKDDNSLCLNIYPI